ncbi:TetR/AcrR family transcriptional regulator [Actomonas aquatica]|uniref:TetR/AcrR family transcriptional regulator n=1 Tax=Actomonas aquatica TaxID=2866162 RepID=A0ABZ1CEK2_9BACT|nr:TetR/AcrR family transcriptional regulator [Opitutus sp. WL0086]WRQ88710.1 TetR/AcrR family transcriptional regulator [Opitutus sp. WL0086]
MAIEPNKSRKEQLLDVASYLFYEQGYHATGIKQIIEKAGIAKGTFFSHFQSKEQLGVAWLHKRHHTWNSWLQAYLSDQDPTPMGQILGIFNFVERWMQDCDYRGCAFLNALSEMPDATNPLRKEILEHKQDLLNQLEHLVSRLKPEESPEAHLALAHSLLVLLSGCITEMQVFRALWPIDAARRAACALIERK